MKAPWKIWLPAQEMWVNPLMGWTSSSDTAESAFRKMTFTTPDEAASFLDKQGIEYTIEEKSANYACTYRPPRWFQYGDNFRCAAHLLPLL
jgi:ETC complex I subunit conserved region